jgi:phosphate starvation-inducible protein PhoH and related proteins
MAKELKPKKTRMSTKAKRIVNEIDLENDNIKWTSIDSIYSEIRKRLKVHFKTHNQELLWNTIEKKDITFSTGQAGTGKSTIAILKALDMLINPDNKFKKITILKPIVQAGDEDYGFLTGDLKEKTTLYFDSFYYLFEKYLGSELTTKLINNKIIEEQVVGFARGANWGNQIVIIDEAQNLTKKGIITLLTRIENNCKYIILGDLDQSDIFKNPKDSGLYLATTSLIGIKEIGFVNFTDADIVRNPLITKMLNAIKDEEMRVEQEKILLTENYKTLPKNKLDLKELETLIINTIDRLGDKIGDKNKKNGFLKFL